MNRSNCNVGKKIMILQEQLNHQKKIQNIYQQSSPNLYQSPNTTSKYSYLHKKSNKKNQFTE